MKIWNVISGVASTLFVASILTFGLSTGIASAHDGVPKEGHQCRGHHKHDDGCPVEGPPNAGGDTTPTHEAVVGRGRGFDIEDSKECNESSKLKDSTEFGDFYDRGTRHAHPNNIDDDHVGNICEHLSCGASADGVLACGAGSAFNLTPLPLIDIGGGVPEEFTGLFNLWDQDMTSQGDPRQCFGDDGVVGAAFSVRTAAEGVQVQFFFKGLPDSTVDNKKCAGASSLINYEAFIRPCRIESGNLPPVHPVDTFIECDEGALATVIHTGGGGVAAKCGCHATGMLTQVDGLVNSVIRIRELTE